MAHDIFFDEQTHTYLVDGQEVPSVTEILKPLHRSYEAVNPSVLEYAANRGKAIHSALEAYDKGEEFEVSPETLPYIEAYMDWADIYKPRWEAIEEITYHENLGYIGTLDRAGYLNEVERVVVDIKTSQPTKEALVSVCLQTMAYGASYFNGGKCKRYGLFLKGDGTWRFQDCDEYEWKYNFYPYDVWTKLLETHKMITRLLATGKGKK